MRAIQKGATDQSVIIRIIDSTTFLPETAVEHDTSGIDLWYRREGATKTSITEAALAALDSAHSDGGIEHIGDGYYRLDAPDAAFATGANGVAFGGTVTGMVVIGCYVPLVDYNPQDAVRMGMTALPNAAADAAGGLIISDAGGLDADAQIGTKINDILTDTEDIQTRLPAALVGGRMDSNVGAISADATAADNLEAALDGTGGVTITAALTGNVTGNLSGSVGSVTAGVSLANGAITAAKFGAGAIDAAAISSDAGNEIADAILNRDMSTGTDSGSATVRTPRQALRMLRNKTSIAAGTLTVTKEDDTTESWTAEVETTAGDPISSIDPASS